MPLRGDQRALLQLLCERGQSYEDISGLLGVPTDDVRRQAREALSELGGADPDAEVGLTDYLLGQADPIGRADAVRYLQTDRDALELAQRIEDELRAIAPDSVLPKLPDPRGKRARAAIPAAGEEPEQRSSRASGAEPLTAGENADSRSRSGKLLAAFAAAAVVLILAILAIAGVFSSEEEPTMSTETTASTSDDATTAADDSTRNLTTVELSPVEGSGVGGTAVFGLVSDQQLYIDLDIQGLPASERDSTVLAWLMVGPSGGYPINNPVDAPITPDENGNYSGRIAVPSAVALTVGSNATSVKLSSSNIREIANAAREAAETQAPILEFIGTELASGDIPIAEQANGGAAGGGGAGEDNGGAAGANGG